MSNGDANQVSAGVAPCNMVGFVKLFRTSVARQVSRKVEPLPTSATARNGCRGEKTRVSTCNGGLRSHHTNTYSKYNFTHTIAFSHRFQPSTLIRFQKSFSKRYIFKRLHFRNQFRKPLFSSAFSAVLVSMKGKIASKCVCVFKRKRISVDGA